MRRRGRAALHGAPRRREKTKQEAKTRREKLLAVQLELAQAEALQSTVAGQINNIHLGKVSQGFRASKAAGTVAKLCADLSRADELVAKVRRKLRILQGVSTGEVCLECEVVLLIPTPCEILHSILCKILHLHITAGGAATEASVRRAAPSVSSRMQRWEHLILQPCGGLS